LFAPLRNFIYFLHGYRARPLNHYDLPVDEKKKTGKDY
jgi:hypothetical protein